MNNVEEIKVGLDGSYMNFIRVDGGEKPIVIIAGVSLNGIEGQGAAIASAYTALTSEYTLYFCDRKKNVPPIYSVDEMAEELCSCLNKLGIERADFYGVSMGGFVAQTIAVKYPERVNKLILCSTFARANKHFNSCADNWIALAEKRDAHALTLTMLKDIYTPRFVESVMSGIPALEALATEENCTQLAALLRAAESFDMYDRLNEIRCPVLVLADKNDAVIPVECAYELREKLGCESVIYDRYSHAVYDEAPELKTAVAIFLRK